MLNSETVMLLIDQMVYWLSSASPGSNPACPIFFSFFVNLVCNHCKLMLRKFVYMFLTIQVVFKNNKVDNEAGESKMDDSIRHCNSV